MNDLKAWVEKYLPELNPIQVGMLLRKVGGLMEDVIGRDEISMPITDIYRTPEELQTYYVDIQNRDELRAEQRARAKRMFGGLAEPELQAKPSHNQADKSIAGGAP